jgi:phospholipid/cholesterol/gamma-HCH transport system substrate-binding protein
MNTETRVGLFVIASIAVLITVIFLLGDVNLKRQYTLYVIFKSVEGLPNNATVKVSGVEVGKVANVRLVDNKAKIKVHINHGIPLHKDAVASILSTGIIGTKFVAISMGSPGEPLLRDGDTIDGKEGYSYEEIFAKLIEGVDELKKTFSDVRGDGMLGTNLNEAVARINNIARRLDEITAKHQGDIEVTLSNFKEISEKFNAALAYIENIAKKIDSGEGMAAKIVNDQEMGNDLKKTVTSLKEVSGDAKKFFNRVSQFTFAWDYQLRYDTERKQYKNDAGIRISPRPGKYYAGRINNIGDANQRDPGEERMNTITAELGKDFGPFTLHGGVIRSQGGVGLAVRPINRVELTGDAYYFSRKKSDKYSNGYDTPVYDAGGRFSLTKWLKVGGQVEDIKGDKNFNTYMNLIFEDDDIAYLLGFIGLAR